MDKQFEKIFDPSIVKKNLILSSLYLTAFELLNSSIIERIRTFYTTEIKNGKLIPTQEYNCKVVQRKIEGKENLFNSSCLWLVKNKVISIDEYEEIKNIKEHRNDVAHRIQEIIVDIEKDINLNYFLRIKELLRKIENWWILEFEVTLNPDFDNKKIKNDEVTSGRELLLNHLISIVFEDKKNTNN